MNARNETITLPISAVLRHTPAATLAQALLDQLTNGHDGAASLPGTTPLPPIGAEWNGGLYAGLSIADNVPVALVLLPGDENLNWSDAQAWAEKQGGVLPSRFDHLVLLKNLKNQFKPEWYWSDEHFASYDGYAWIQSFLNGFQFYYRKSDNYRARAVRRLVIQ